jgi:hypothetical protein
MTDLTVADRTPRIQTIVGGVASSGPFAVPWEFINAADNLVFIGTSAIPLIYGTDYSIVGTAIGVGFSSGTLTLVVPVANTTVTIARQTSISRATAFPVSGPFDMSQLNLELDRMVMMIQELRDRTARSMVLAPTTSTATSGILPSPVPLTVIGWSTDGLSLANYSQVGLSAVPLVATQYYRANAAGTQVEQRTNAQTRADLGLPAVAVANAGLAAVFDPTGTNLIAGPSGVGTNKIINGGMNIDQRTAGAATTPAATIYHLDRWQYQATTGSKLTLQQVATRLTPNVPNSVKITVAATYVPAATDLLTYRQAIEGLNCADLDWGTAAAKPVTVSFWVQSSVTGLYGVTLQNGNATRTYPATFAITAANVPQLVILTFPGDTAGVWATDSSAGIWLVFDLGSGANFIFAPGAWSANNAYTATGALKFVSQVNGSTFLLSAVDFKPGLNATPFELRPIGVELALAQRYFQKSFAQGQAPATAVGTNTGEQVIQVSAAGAANNSFPVRLPVVMRAVPTTVFYSPAAATAQVRDISNGLECTGTVPLLTDGGGRFQCQGAAGTTVNSLLGVHYSLAAEF